MWHGGGSSRSSPIPSYEPIFSFFTSYLNCKEQFKKESWDPEACSQQQKSGFFQSMRQLFSCRAVKENAVLWHLQIWSKKQSSYETKYRIRCHRLNLALIKISPASNRTITALCQRGAEGPRVQEKRSHGVSWPWLGWRGSKLGPGGFFRWLFSLRQTLAGSMSQGHHNGPEKCVFFHVKTSLRWWERLVHFQHLWSPNGVQTPCLRQQLGGDGSR